MIVGCSSRLQGFTERRAAFLASFFPGLAPLDMARLGSDIIAGITLAALGIPEVIGLCQDYRHSCNHRTLHTLPARLAVCHVRFFAPSCC